MEDISRQVFVETCSSHAGDNGAGEWLFTVRKTVEGLDVSQLSAYLKIRFSDESHDKMVLSVKSQTEDEVVYSFPVTLSGTRVSGNAVCQLVFENADGSVAVNSDLFSVEIKESVEADEYFILEVPSAIRQLQNELTQMIEELREDYEGGKANFSANSINPYSGNKVEIKVGASGGLARLSKGTEESAVGVVGQIGIGDGGGEIKVKNGGQSTYTSTFKVTPDKISAETKGDLNLKINGKITVNSSKSVKGAFKSVIKTLSPPDWVDGKAVIPFDGVEEGDMVLLFPYDDPTFFYSFSPFVMSAGSGEVVVCSNLEVTEEFSVRLVNFG